MSSIVTVRSGSAFSTDSASAGYRAKVDADGTVRVWDSVARHYTLCHSLTERQMARVRRLAAG